MRIPYNWLKEYVDLDLSPQDLANVLTMAGFEISQIELIDHEAVLDLELTVNRGDCLSLVGIAREVAALTKKPLKLPATQSPVKSKKLNNNLIKVSIVDEELCHRYTARIIDGIKVGPSPDWLKDRLKKTGISSVNNVVDVTNFVLMELGQPMHAFDYHRIANKTIIVCQATTGEQILALDGQTYNLSPSMTIIADTESPIALAGIIGGLPASVHNETTSILLECASFLPQNVRKTAKSLGIQTESSYRFERGVDIEGLYRAQDRAANLILELCGGKASEIIDCYPKKFERINLTLRPFRVNKILSTQIELTEITEILKRLCFDVKGNEELLEVRVPSFRYDITREIDLIEEIARIYGYGRIPTTLPKSIEGIPVNQDYKIDKLAKSVLTSCGFYEVITYSFSNPILNEKAMLGNANPLIIHNPLSEEERLMSSSLIPNLLSTLSWNLNRGITVFKIFELAKTFRQSQQGLPEEKRMLVGAVMGNWKEKNWQEERIESSFYHLKGVVERLMKDLGISSYSFKQASYPSFHPQRCALIKQDNLEVGVLGQIHPQVAENFKLPLPVYLFELNWEGLASLFNAKRSFKPPPKYPSIVRDLAIVVKEDVRSEEIIRVIEENGQPLLEKVILFDLYQGKKIDPGKKGLAYSLTYRHPQHTLTDEVVNDIQGQIIQALQDKLEASLRRD